MSYSGIHLLDPSSPAKYFKWYDRKFAFIPVLCNSERVWLKHYYVKHIRSWRNGVPASHIFRHPKSAYIVETQCITEADYIIDKLTEGF